MQYLRPKFGSKIISRRADLNWPARSPDLNVLDFWFWIFAEAQVYRRKPQSLAEVIECVDDVAASVSPDMIRSAVSNLRNRVILCFQEKGGHFQHLL
jgi:hypothetical protein